jgi:hypothetical protein
MAIGGRDNRVRIQDDASDQGAVRVINFGSNLSVSISGDTATITAAVGGAPYTPVANYSALPGAGTVAADTVYAVLSPEGIWPFNRKPAGLYKSDGVSTWTHLGPMPDLLKDGNFGIVNSADTSKILQIGVGNITTGTTRTLQAPNKDGTIATTKDAYPPQLAWMGF